MAAARTQIPLAEAKKAVLDALAAGAKVEAAMAAVGRTRKTYENWRAADEAFRRQVDDIRAARASAKERGVDEDAATISFEDFRKEYLGMDTYRHQRAWISVINGEDYEPIPGETFIPGSNRKRILINTPPFHAKSATLTVDYVTYRICMNPNVRVIIVSKTQAQAKKFLYAIKQRLTGRAYAKLQAAYAPEGGFKGKGEWSSTRIYVSGNDSGEKDPTVEALGIGGQIYGARADLIILDDVADVSNAHEFEKQINYLQQDVASRLDSGLLIVVGTRVGPQDIYSELMNGDRYLTGTSPWTHLAQPAVLEFAEDPKDWVTLWPRSSRPLDENDDEEPGPDGLYRAQDGPKMARIRDEIKPATWALVYQQQAALGDDATFRPVCVWGSTDRRRKAGPLTAGAWGHPARGGEGMYTIASMDPGMGVTFAVVGKVDRATQKRWIENAFLLNHPTPQAIRDLIMRVTTEYRVQEWVIEEQGFQGFLVHDETLRAWCATRGVRISGHYTGKNKLDPDFGVGSMESLFGTSRRINEGAGREVFNKGSNLIILPDPESSPGIKALIEQLLTWQPGKRGAKLRQDGPMALWFFETRARVILGHERSGRVQTHVNLPFMPRGMTKKRVVAPFAFMGGPRRAVG